MDHLTSPNDQESKDSNEGYKVQKTVVLSDDQVQSAMDTLNIRAGLKKVASFPKVDRYICDPVRDNQKYCLHSFVPSQGATPDKDGIFGMLKCRGTFETTHEMDTRAEDIVRNIDSYHELYHGYVGKPFPFSVDSKYIEEEVEIDIKKKIVSEVSSAVKKMRDNEKVIKEEVKDQEEALIYDVDDSKVEDPAEYYTGIRVKRANLIHTIMESKKKLIEMQDYLRTACSEIKKIDKSSKKLYKKEFIKRYMTAREKAGIPADDDTLIQYLGDGLPDGVYD
jgi:hypothetical protein